jgi:DHA3 family macrolide efflux protein-like MFS transporter
MADSASPETEKTGPTNDAAGERGSMRAFTLVWIGQMASIFGSSMTQFGLMIWAWMATGQATALALMGFFSFAPRLLMTPIAGALVDRWDRKTTMIISDLAAGLGTVAVLLLYQFGTLEIWHLYVVAVFVGLLGSFQFPAYSAAVTMMVDKKNYARATAMLGMAESVATIFGPPTAAFLLIAINLKGIMLIDVCTFCLAIGILLAVKIPQPERAKDMGKGILTLFKDAGYGFKYIWKRKPLLGLQMTYFTTNFFGNMAMVLLAPMILAKTLGDEVLLGTVFACSGAGGLVGGIILTLWGGSKTRKVLLIMVGIAIEGITTILFGLGAGVAMWAATGFVVAFSGPMIMGSSQAIWQSKVEPNRQGRVFAARGVIAMAAGAVGIALAGPLADGFFEPSMASGGGLSATFGWLTGTGPGAGMGLLMVFCGIASLATAIVAYSIPRIRNLETLVPDHEAVQEQKVDGLK